MKRLCLAFLGVLLSGPAWAVTCAVPYVFVSGATIYAAQINSNFSTLDTCFASAAHSGANADISSLAGVGAGVPIAGTITNNNAAAGYVGQEIESDIVTGSAIDLTTGTTADLTHVSLTAGDWDCSGVVLSKPAATTTTSLWSVWTSVTTADASPDETDGLTNYGSTGTTIQTGGTTGVVRYSLASTTSVYLSVNATFASSTMKAFGLERCRRVR